MKKTKEIKTYMISARGISEVCNKKNLAIRTYEKIKDLLIENNIPGTVTLKEITAPGKFSVISKTTIKKDFYNRNKPVGYKN